MKNLHPKIKLIAAKVTLGAMLAGSFFYSGGPVEAAVIKDINQASDYARPAISRLAKEDLIRGDERSFFNPHDTTTRAEMITMIVQALEMDVSQVPDKATFRDVPTDHWAYPYIETAYRQGIVKGVASNVFGVDQKCTREQMAAMFIRSLGFEDEEIQTAKNGSNLSKYQDRGQIADWSRGAVALSVATGLLQGTSASTFDPQGYAQREQMAVLTDRFLANRESIFDQIEDILENGFGKHILGYYTEDYQGDLASFNSLKYFGEHINSIATFNYHVDKQGNVTGSSPANGIKLAISEGITPLALIHNFRDGAFNAADAHELLASKANRQRLINNMIKILKKEGYQGVNIDIESVQVADRDSYSLLVKEFRAALEPLGYLTTVSIPAKTNDSLKNSWAGAFDYQAIGQYADWVQIMTYDEHWIGDSPGPISSLPWVEKVVQFAAREMPADKILLGIATYGYDWSSVKNKTVTYKSVKNLISTYQIKPQWSDAYGVPYFTYTKDGVKHEVWYENAESARLKFNLVNDYGLMGIGVWRLGFEDESFWDAVEHELQD